MTTPRRVLHVVRPAQGGIRQHVLNLLAHTDRARFTLSLAAPPEFLETVPEGDVSGAFPLPISPTFSPPRDFAAALRLAFLVRSVDLVHAHGLRAGWITTLAHLRRPFPFVVTAHNLVDPGAFFARFALGLIGRRAAKVLAVSQATADGLAAGGVPRAKIRIIPNGIDPAFFGQCPTPQQARLALSVAEKEFVVGCIARLSPEKGVDVLLRAAALMPGMTFLVAGDGPERERLRQTAAPNVRLLGRVSDTRILLAAADILAVPSRQEGQGIVALEAMAVGVPVVASRVGGLGEMLTEEKTALLVPPDDPAALAAAFMRLQGDGSLRQTLKAQSKTLVHEKYTLSQMVRAVEAVYEG